MVLSSSFSYVELRFLFALQSRHVFLAYRNFTRYEDIPSTLEHCIDLCNIFPKFPYPPQNAPAQYSLCLCKQFFCSPYTVAFKSKVLIVLSDDIRFKFCKVWQMLCGS